jgi:hypothetical protein
LIYYRLLLIEEARMKRRQEAEFRSQEPEQGYGFWLLFLSI